MKLSNIFKKKNREPSKKVKADLQKITRLILPIAIAFFFSLILISNVDSFIFPAYILISGFIIGYCFQSEYLKTDSDEKDIAVMLYRMFIVKAGEKTDYRSAFENAVESLPISDLKARTKDFIESGYSSDNPLTITKSRSEFLLTYHVMHLVYINEEYDYSALTPVIKYLREYETEGKAQEIEPVSISKMITFVFFMLSLISLFLYES